MINSGLIQSKSELLSGGIAQLVERLPCTQEVSGSSPLTSTLTSYNQPQKEIEISTLTIFDESRNAGVENSSQNLENCIEIKSSKRVYHLITREIGQATTIKRLSGQVTKG